MATLRGSLDPDKEEVEAKLNKAIEATAKIAEEIIELEAAPQPVVNEEAAQELQQALREQERLEATVENQKREKEQLDEQLETSAAQISEQDDARHRHAALQDAIKLIRSQVRLLRFMHSV